MQVPPGHQYAGMAFHRLHDDHWTPFPMAPAEDPARRVLFGRNPVGLSFVTGHGTDYAHSQRVRHFAHTLDPSYPPPPPGSLAGGPASKTYPGFPGDPRFDGLPPQLCYVDEPTSETTNDVCIRWNASLVWLASYLADMPRRHPITRG